MTRAPERSMRELDIAVAWPSLKEAAAGPPAPATYRSPGLELLTDRLALPRRHRVLDLGAPRGANVDFLGQYRCVIHVEDLFRMLVAEPARRPDEEGYDVEAAVEGALSLPREARFDAVLGWDLFDYLDEATIRAVMRRVSACAGPGTVLFLLMSNRDAIPAVPSRFTIVDRCRVAFEASTEEMRASRRYTPRALERMMPSFRLLHSFLLGDGMQDYLLTYS